MESTMATLELTSPAFEHESTIPSRYTCDGDDISPPLRWSAGPERTRSYALVADDPDAPRNTWVHWVAWNLHATELPEHVAPDGVSSEGMQQGKNSWGRIGYGGPCPPSGSHRYFFKVYALDVELALAPDADAEALRRAMKGHVLAEGELMGRYVRQ